jgi:lipid-binding SYLF domain-containing protein
MTSRASVFTLLAGLVLAVTSTTVCAQEREEGRLMTASQVLEELRHSRDQYIPDRLLERAYGIAVIPDMTKVAFFAGGRHGNGVMVVRDKEGRFTSPIFVTMTGGSFGWQWGVQSTDIVLVFTTRKGVEGITGGKVTLGADASVAAGPVGRQASAATDATFKAEVYSYSRSRGAFVGVALDGTVLSIDDDANAAFYDKHSVSASDIMSGAVSKDSASSKRFLAAVGSSTRTQKSAGPDVARAAESPQSATPAAQAAAQPQHSAAAQTFPLEDQHPGSEPK